MIPCSTKRRKPGNRMKNPSHFPGLESLRTVSRSRLTSESEACSMLRKRHQRGEMWVPGNVGWDNDKVSARRSHVGQKQLLRVDQRGHGGLRGHVLLWPCFDRPTKSQSNTFILLLMCKIVDV